MSTTAIEPSSTGAAVSTPSAFADPKAVALTVCLIVFAALMAVFIIIRVFQQYRRRMARLEVAPSPTPDAHTVDLEAATLKRTASLSSISTFGTTDEKKVAMDMEMVTPPPLAYAPGLPRAHQPPSTPQERLGEMLFGGAARSPISSNGIPKI